MDVFFVVTFVVTVVIRYWRVECGLIESHVRGAAMIARSPMEYAVYGEDQLVKEYRNDMSWRRTWTTVVSMLLFWLAISSNINTGSVDASVLVDLMFATIAMPIALASLGYLSWVCYYEYRHAREAVRDSPREVVPRWHPDQIR